MSREQPSSSAAGAGAVYNPPGTVSGSFTYFPRHISFSSGMRKRSHQKHWRVSRQRWPTAKWNTRLRPRRRLSRVKLPANHWRTPPLLNGQKFLLYATDDFRLFCGDLGSEVNDDVLTKAFSRFPSFNMARVIRDKRTGKTKGYGFVSFSNPSDLAAAIKEMNGKYVGNRPIKLRKSNWKERTDVEALERHKNHPQKKQKMHKKSILHK